MAPNTLVPLLNDGSARPLDDLVAKYGQNLQPNQLIRIDGKVRDEWTVYGELAMLTQLKLAEMIAAGP